MKPGDIVIIKKGCNALKVESGSIGQVVEVKQIQGSKLLPGSDSETYKVDLVSVLSDGQTLLFGSVKEALQKAVPVCTVEERDQIAAQLAAQSTRATRWLQYALRYRREWIAARRELVTMSELLSSKDIEVQQMRAMNALARDTREQADELARGIQASTDSAAEVTEVMYGKLEARAKKLEQELKTAQQNGASMLANAKRPQVAAENYLKRQGYTGDLMEMIKALVTDRDVAQRAFNGSVAASSEPGKIEIIELDFAGEKPETKPAV